MKFLHLLLIFCAFLWSVESANILAIFQFPFFSHQRFHQKVMQILLDEGHSVTVFSTHPHDYKDHPNATQYVFEDSVKIHSKYTDMLMYRKKKMHYSQILLQHEVKAYVEAAEHELSHPELQRMIKNTSDYQFDLVVVECFVCTSLLFAEIFDCPVAIVSAIDAPYMFHKIMGNDVNPFKYSESLFMPYIHGHMSVSEKINSFIFQLFHEFVFNAALIYNNLCLNYMHFSHLGLGVTKAPIDRIGLLMANTNHAFGHVRALMPHSIQIGFTHVEKPKPISDLELKEYLDNSMNGVIIKALGSTVNTKSLGIENIKKFLDIFSKTKMNVLWKLDEIEEGLEIPHNVKIVSWLPLADALAHPNVKLLIFHGGIFTAYEAIDRGVPMIAFPLAYDQFMNARLMTHKGIAMEMDLNNFKDSDLSSAIQEMTKPKYAANVRKMRTLAYDQPINNRDLIVWHVNNLIKNRIVYSKDFGSLSYFGTPTRQFYAYLFAFLGLIYFIFKKIIKIVGNNGEKVKKL
ncbi:UDP-glucosyltransferase 2-like [Chironomus tepperi]|uniref:UDP-glucosyltransferase 2-like n=1 Tax=Chironomus tepperi TaxID=113505 RepID=UPI00391F590C